MASISEKEELQIFQAISNGKVRKLSRFLERTGDLEIRDHKQRTLLMHAVCCGKEDVRTHVVRMHLRHGCDVNAQGRHAITALMLACMERDRVDIVRLISHVRVLLMDNIHL